MEFGRLGVWTHVDGMGAEDAAAFVGRVEALGYGTLWIPEAVGRDPFALIGFLAGRTDRLGFATGIANVYARDPMTLRAIRETLGEIAPGRFALGLGVSHAPLVTGLRGHAYGKPVTTMRNVIDAMEKAPYQAPRAASEAPLVLAALRRNMLRLAAERARGAHPYLVTPEHTKWARGILGEGPLLLPEQMVLLERDAKKARAIARKNLQIYLGLPNYRNLLLELGFEAAEIEGGGSDRLVDALVAWGDEGRIAERLQAHWDAGADHVCIQPFHPEGAPVPDERILEALAPARS